MSNSYTNATDANPIELCIKDDHDTISAYVREHGIVQRSEHISAFTPFLI